MATNWTNITTIEQIPAAANAIAPFWTVILYMIYFILVVALLPFGIIPALLASSFAALLMGILLVYANLIVWQYVLTFLGVIIACIIYTIIFESKY